MNASAHPHIKAILGCRVCGKKELIPILSLGEQYVSNFVSSAAEQKGMVPLNLVLCEIKSGGCGLLQLRHTTPGELMYEHYWYLSGLNESMRVALADITACINKIRPLQAGDTVLDIGCNDGTLLRSYPVPGLTLIGIDPAKNLVPYSSKGTSLIINDYFNAAAIEKQKPGVKFKAITSIAMFYDLDDPNAFVSDIAKVLAKDGVWVVQMSYLPLMLQTNAFDNICHEHLEYYSLAAMENLLARHGLQVYDVSENDVNGGSARFYIGFDGNATMAALSGAKERVADMRSRETALGLDSRKVYDDFASRVTDIKKQTVDFVKAETAKGKKVFVYGASTKGNTLLQTFGLDSKLLPLAAERNPDKYGKMTIGTLIPIVSEEEARAQKPDYFLVLPWHFRDAFLKRERAYLESGGKFIFPLPEFQVIGAEVLTP